MSALAIAPGSIFARDFLIERALAEGGMGAVYVVKQLSTGRRRALKLMQPELVQNNDLRRRFLLEAKVGASIASEHVVEVQVAGIDDATGAPFLVMELLDGVDLATRLEVNGPLSLQETRELFRQLCHALRLAHQAGIVHRDLKPPNVFLARPRRASADGPASDSRSDFHVKVLDFGIAKMTTDATAGGTRTGMIGTPLWMAPEQADHVPVTPAADVWALGLMLYTCVTGRVFWRTGGGRASLQQIMREMLFDPIPPATVRAGEHGARFPPALDAVVARAIARRPEQRFPDAGTFFAALDGALAGKSSVPMSAGAAPAGSDFELDDATGPSLELDVKPQPITIAKTRAETFAGPVTPAPLPAAAIEVLRVPVTGSAPRLGDSWPMWPVFVIVPLALLGLGFYAFRSMTAAPAVSCRLCTVESGTFANGALPLREVRHSIEARFPELDERCIRDATTSGRAKIRWRVSSAGEIDERSVTGGGVTGECLREKVARALPWDPSKGPSYVVLQPGQQVSFGYTEITYILEWNPSLEPLSKPER